MQSFALQGHYFADENEAADNEKVFSDCEFVVIDGSSLAIEKSTAAVQTLKFVAPDAKLVVVLGAKATPANTEFIKKSGANSVIFEDEFYEKSKIEYFCAQAIKPSYLPVKTTDLAAGVVLECPLYHLMPLAKKFVLAVPAGTAISEAKFQKLLELGEVYIHKSGADAFGKYAMSLDVKSAAALPRRCRGLFLNLNVTFSELVLHISDQSTNSSFADGKKLYDRIELLASDLLTTLSAVGEAWHIINNAGFGGFGQIDRGPAIAAYSGLLSFISGVGDPKTVMIASLLADIGLLDVLPKATAKIRLGQMAEMNAEERASYENHPVYSVNQCLSKKVALPDLIKSTILYSHERIDQKGFPNRPLPEKILDEAFILQICEMIDLNTQVRIGESRKDINEIRKQIFDQEFASANRMTIEFLSRIKTSLLA